MQQPKPGAKMNGNATKEGETPSTNSSTKKEPDSKFHKYEVLK